MNKKLITLLLSGLIFSSCSSYIEADSKIESISGKNRFETAIGISKYGWRDGSKDLIIVGADSVVDALSVGPLARIKDAPVLLSERDKLSPSTLNEINRLGPDNIILVGGDGSLSTDLMRDIESKGYKVSRIAGRNRSETSYKIADEIKSIYDQSGRNIEGIMVVQGYKGLADAAGAGAVAAKMGYPLLVASRVGDFDQSIARDIDGLKAYIVGGAASDLGAYFKNPTRISGKNRTQTNVNLINAFYPGGFSKAFVAKDGKNNPSELIDSVAIGGLAAREEAPVILVNSAENISPETRKLVGGQVDKLVKVGGGIDLHVAHRTKLGTSDRSKFEYWDEANYYSDDLLMTAEQIDRWNRENLGKTSLLRDPIRVDNKTYALMTRREIARLKPGYPGNVSFDSTANTAINPWEPIYIESYSQNKKWAYVKSYNSYGWLPTDSFAVVSRQLARKYEAMPFAVIKNRQYLNQNTRIDMGNKMPMENGRVLLPVRASNGSLSTRAIDFDEGSMSRGYLPFTRANIVKQALKFQNEVYGWGGSKNAHDCSSLVQDVFKSMGLMLPRDSKDQEAAGFGRRVPMVGSKLGKLSGLQPGTALYMKGHVMLYIGKDKNSRHHMIHQYAGHYESGRYVSVYSARISPVTIGAGGNRTYIDNVRMAVDWIR